MNRPDIATYLDGLEAGSAAYEAAVVRCRKDCEDWQQRKSKVGELIKLLERADWDFDIDDLGHALSVEHRTHQQCAGRGVVKILAAMAVLDYDLRNEATVMMAQTASAAIQRIALPYI